MNNELRSNTWDNNYWGRKYIFPKLIKGRIGDIYQNFRWFNVDWNPASEPYDIPGSSSFVGCDIN